MFFFMLNSQSPFWHKDVIFIFLDISWKLLKSKGPRLTSLKRDNVWIWKYVSFPLGKSLKHPFLTENPKVFKMILLSRDLSPVAEGWALPESPSVLWHCRGGAWQSLQQLSVPAAALSLPIINSTNDQISSLHLSLGECLHLPPPQHQKSRDVL